MALVVPRRLALPLWVTGFLAVGLNAPPPATLLVIAALAIGAIALAMPAVPWLRPRRSLVPVLSSGRQDKTSAAITMGAGTGVRIHDDEPTVNAADDAMDLVRMDDDGGWQMARPLA